VANLVRDSLPDVFGIVCIHEQQQQQGGWGLIKQQPCMRARFIAAGILKAEVAAVLCNPCRGSAGEPMRQLGDHRCGYTVTVTAHSLCMLISALLWMSRPGFVLTSRISDND
jgi:hypothetical protein